MSRSVIYRNGRRYIEIEDGRAVQERRERDGYGKGYADGKKYAVLLPPTSIFDPLPRLDLRKLPRKFDKEAYAKGFKEAYYRLVAPHYS